MEKVKEHKLKESSYKKVPKVKDYELLEKIGKGSFSKVFKARNSKNGEIVAIKRINKDQLEKKLGANYKEILQRELMILMQINKCKNIIQIRDVVRTKDHFYIIFEYCKGGDLSHYLKKHKRLPEKLAKNFMGQIASALKPLNKLRIVHRDLKLSNFLLSDDSEEPIVKICDFGLARQKGSKDSSLLFDTLCGTPIYMAPEVLMGNKYDERADLWSMGVILYEMLIGHPPFEGNSLSDLIDKVKAGRYIIPTSITISKPCINLIGGLLISEPNKRFTWEDFFNHPFIIESDEGAEEGKDDFEEIDSQTMSIIKKESQEKAAKAMGVHKNQVGENQ